MFKLKSAVIDQQELSTGFLNRLGKEGTDSGDATLTATFIHPK